MLLYLAVFTPAQAADPTAEVASAPIDRSTVLALLSGIEDTPSADSLRRLGPEVSQTLLSIAQDASVARNVRYRAVHALGNFPSTATLEFLSVTLSDSAADTQLRSSAAWALCNGWGDEGVTRVASALSDPNEQFRNQVVRAIAKVGTPTAVGLLNAHLGIEQSAMVRQTLNAALGVK